MDKAIINQEILNVFRFPMDDDMKLFKPFSSVSMWDIKNCEFKSSVGKADINLFFQFKKYVRKNIMLINS